MYWFGDIWFWIFLIALIVLFLKVSNLKKEIETLKRSLLKEKKNFVGEEKTRFDDGSRYVVAGQEKFEEIQERTVEEKHESEFKFGSKWLTIVGVVSMIFGIGFFLKYAFDKNLISETGRVILGFISGVIFVILGDKFKFKLKDYAHYLIGGGFAIIMLSVYFGLEYNLYSNAVAFLIMIITTFMSGLLAHKLDSKILAGTTILAGFLSPILASSGQANEIVLFNYILILLGGMFWLVKKHGWNFLIWGSLIGTIILYGGSMAEYYSNSVFWFYWIYLIIFFGIFAVAPVNAYFADREDGLKGNVGNIIISVIAGGIFMLVSYGMFESKIVGQKILCTFNCDVVGGALSILKNFYWVIGLIPAVVYLYLSKKALAWRDKLKDNTLLYLILGMTTFAIAMIPALQFSGKWITFAWLIEALILGFIYYKSEVKILINLAVASLIAGLLRLIFIDSFLRVKEYNQDLRELVVSFYPIFNERSLIYLIGVIVIFALAYFAFNKKNNVLAKWLGVIGNLGILLWIYLELDSSRSAGYISPDLGSLLLSVFYLIYGGILIWIGILKRYLGFRIFGLGVIAFVILKTYLVDIWDFYEVIRILAFIILGGFILLVSFYYSKISQNLKDFLKSGE